MISSGATTGGTLVYALGDENEAKEEYSTTIPTAVSADKYYVWYKVIGGDKYMDVDARKVEATITKAQATITVDTTPIVKTYGDTIVIPEATSNFGTVACDKVASDLVNVGTYTITYTVSETDDYSGDTKTVSVTINKNELTVPSISGTYTYTGSLQTVTVENFDSETMEYANDSVSSGTDAGTYKVKVSLKDSSNYKWATSFNGEIEWKINKAKVDEPTLETSSFVYDNTEKEVTINGAQAYMTKSNNSVTKATAKGSYTITYTLDGNHEWNEGSDGIISWSITKAQATITVDTTPIVKTYGDTIVIPEATSNFGTVTCDKVASDLVNVGTYTITYTVSETDDYSGDTKTVSVTINKKELTVPSISGTYTYTGSLQTVTVENFDSETMEYANDSVSSGTDAGTYKVKVSLKDSSNYKWATSFNGEIEWKINKATPVYTAPVAAEGLVYNGDFQFACKTAGTVNDSNSYHWEYKYKLLDNESHYSENQYSSDVIRASIAGTYTVCYKLVVTNENYADPNIDSSFEVVVAKVTPTVTAPTAYNTAYPGQGNHVNLCSQASTNFGTIVYQLAGCQEEYNPPKAFDKGYYTVYYWVVGDNNINDVAAQSIICSIY